MHLEGKIDKIDYEDRYTQLRKIFESGKKLTEFDSEVFKTVIEKVILGGHDQEGKNAQKECSHQAGQACGNSGSADKKIP